MPDGSRDPQYGLPRICTMTKPYKKVVEGKEYWTSRLNGLTSSAWLVKVGKPILAPCENLVTDEGQTFADDWFIEYIKHHFEYRAQFLGKFDTCRRVGKKVTWVRGVKMWEYQFYKMVFRPRENQPNLWGDDE